MTYSIGDFVDLRYLNEQKATFSETVQEQFYDVGTIFRFIPIVPAT